MNGTILKEKRAKLAALKEARNGRREALTGRDERLTDINRLVDDLLANRPTPTATIQPPTDSTIVQSSQQPLSLSSSIDFVLLDLAPEEKVEQYEKECQTHSASPPDSPRKRPVLDTIQEVPVRDLPQKSPESPLKTPAPRQFNESEINDILRGIHLLLNLQPIPL
jgi:hypothetical protein